MELIEAQIAAILALGLGTLFVGLLPTCISQRRRQQFPLLISSLLCFGAGVLLSTSLIHLLPEVREKLVNWCGFKGTGKNGECNENASAEIIVCLGFLILYLIDEFVHFFYGANHQHNGTLHSEMESWSNPTDGTYSTLRLPSASYGSLEDSPLLAGAKQPPYNPQIRRPSSELEIHDGSRPPSQLCHVAHQEPCDATPTAKLGLLMALSVHAMLEGLAVGLEDSVAKVLLMFGAVSCHKFVVTFCLGLEIAMTPGSTACRNFISVLIFSLGSAGGIAVGMVVRRFSVKVSDIPIGILQGLAAGTLLYVTLSELLPRERASWHQHSHRKCAGITQFIFFTLGFTIMIVLISFVSDEA